MYRIQALVNGIKFYRKKVRKVTQTKAKIGDIVTIGGVEFRFGESSIIFYNYLLKKDDSLTGEAIISIRKVGDLIPVKVSFSSLKKALEETLSA